jgi:hypothetical protein
MFRKLALAGALASAVVAVAWAANAPTYKGPSGQDRDAQGVVILDASGNIVGSGGVASDVNVSKVGSTAIDTNSGTKSAGTQRFVIATDQPQLTNALKVEPSGNVADAAADSGNPVKFGAIYESTLPTYTTGQRGNAHIGSRGGLHTNIYGADTNIGAGVQSITSAAVATTASGLNIRGFPYLFNGTNWDPQFVCTSSANGNQRNARRHPAARRR